jgi:hypothetical protein
VWQDLVHQLPRYGFGTKTGVKCQAKDADTKLERLDKDVVFGEAYANGWTISPIAERT